MWRTCALGAVGVVVYWVYLAWPGFHTEVPLPLDTDTGSHDQLPPRGEGPSDCRHSQELSL